MIERRRNGRNRTFLGGAITFNHGQQTLSCRVRNLGTEGARLDFSGAVPLPEELDLSIESRREHHRARVVWRRGDSLGVAFLPRAANLIDLASARRART
ncbi:PilZ domain-containing protein [Methylobacterium radiodurans]|nr:PilZ domain-containing protein [Methylobacterium radiodurans]